MSILVIDDDQDVRDSIARGLLRYGFEVRTAPDGLAGVEEFLGQPADIVIVDVIMPQPLSGIEVIKKIRSGHRRARIIAITGGGPLGASPDTPGMIGTDPYLALAMQAGADGTLAKPFDLDELLIIVRGVAEEGTTDAR